MDNIIDNHAARSYWRNLIPQDFEPEPLVASPPTFQQPTMAWQGHFESMGADDLLTRRLLPFPHRLHRMLQDVENRDKQHIVSWTSGGRSFKVHKPAQFVKEVAPTYFNLAQYKSFKRQLLNYGFVRTANSQDNVVGAFHHPNFRRDAPSECNFIVRGNSNPKSKAATGSGQKRIPENSPPTTDDEAERPTESRQQISTLHNFMSEFTVPTPLNSSSAHDFGDSNDSEALLNLLFLEEAGFHSDGSVDESSEDFSNGSLDWNLPESFEVDGLSTLDWISNCVSLPDLTYVLNTYSNAPPTNKTAGSFLGMDYAIKPIEARGLLHESKSYLHSKVDCLDYESEIISLFGTISGSSTNHNNGNKSVDLYQQDDLSMKKPAARRPHPC